MLTIYDGDRRLGRRRLLTVGALGLAGLTCPAVARRLSAASMPSPLTGKSVIFLFQQGGPSQFETFDPKIDVPDSIRTVTDTIKTSIPGVRFAEPMRQLARLADRLTIVRSFQTNNGGHNLQPVVGPDSLEANIGTHYARVAGTSDARTGVPTNAVLFPSAVSPDVPRPEARGNLSATGPYAKGYAPFVPGAGGQQQANMELNLPRGRFEDRLGILKALDRLHRSVDTTTTIGAVDALRDQAHRLLDGGGIAAALDLSNEEDRTLARYDTSRFAIPQQWNKVNRGKRGYYTSQAKTIGHLLLVARRLCEAGCRFVTIHAGYAGVWDMHADGNNLNMKDGMNAVGRSFDHAVAAFVEDLESRGLQDKILLVTTGEMGRTPRINKRGGRDHWGRLAPLLLYGAGYKGGRIVGQSTRNGGEPATENFTPKHLISTMLRTMIDPGQLRLLSGVPRQVSMLLQPDPIPAV